MEDAVENMALFRRFCSEHGKGKNRVIAAHRGQRNKLKNKLG